jgi:hypothetical protein
LLAIQGFKFCVLQKGILRIGTNIR